LPANLILVVTPIEKEAKVKMGVNPEKHSLFPGCAESEVFTLCKSDLRDFITDLEISEEAKIVSFWGCLDYMQIFSTLELRNKNVFWRKL
jgi:hypothetical protein